MMCHNGLLSEEDIIRYWNILRIRVLQFVKVWLVGASLLTLKIKYFLTLKDDSWLEIQVITPASQSILCCGLYITLLLLYFIPRNGLICSVNIKCWLFDLSYWYLQPSAPKYPASKDLSSSHSIWLPLFWSLNRTN